MKRPSYSVHYVTSAIHGHHFCVPSELYELLVIKAETTPGMLSYALDGAAYSYLEAGKEKTTTVPLVATRIGVPIEHWDFSHGASTSPPSKARQVREAHAKQHGINRVVVHQDDPRTNRIEWRNRKFAHCFLYQGAKRDTAQHQVDTLMAVHEHPLSLAELGTRLKLTPVQTYLVFLRCWLAQRLQWDIESMPLNGQLLVGR